jgi:DNA (cytosine-5)-methyltransferase 1
MKAISLFASAGIGELRLPKDRIDFVLANELLEPRANCYKFFYPQTEMLCGDITDINIKNYIISKAKQEQVDLLLATPPCQGLSTLGKNKVQEQYVNDRRNFLILEVLDIIDTCDFNYILIENVPRFIEMYFPYNGTYCKLGEILFQKYSKCYNIEIQVLNAKDYGVPQSRPRAIIKIWKKGLLWRNPEKEKEITLEQAIGHLPSIEAGEDSGIPWHKAKKEVPRYVESLRHIPSGKSAINSPYHPLKADGTPITGFHNTFKRMNWDQPCPARTTFSGSFTSHNNIHPGRKLADGTYSDARVLTLLEIFIVSSIKENIKFPNGVSERFIREIIGEAIPPLMLSKIISKIGE